MATFGEWTDKNKKKKKKKSTGNLSFTEYTKAKQEEKELGPVKEEKKSWFKSGEFEDGYQFGDVTKTILGTAGDALEDLFIGAAGMGEKAIDSLLYAAPLVAQGEYYQNGGVYQNPVVVQRNQEIFDSMKASNAEIIAKDLYNEEEAIKTIISKPIKSATGFDIEKSSVFGSKMDSLAQSGGQLLGTAGLQAVGVPWYLTTGVTSFGSEAENALNQGATYEEAGLSAAISAGAEILTEKLSGGISFGGNTLDDAMTHAIATRISNKIVRNGLQIGMDFVGEGSEEVISSVFSNLGSALYKEEDLEEILFSEEALEEYADSFIGGGILGGVSSTGKVVKSSMNGTDAVTGLTENEQKVFDKVYKAAIAEQEADGKKLTQKEKSKLYDATMNALEKGYIDTDTIESVIGGDTYSSWKAITDQETATQKEYDELYQMKNMEKSDAQIDRQADLKKFLEDNATKKTQLREKLDGIVSEFVQGSRLSESYNEKARKGQKFEADLDSYTNESAKQTVKNFMEHTESNNTNRTHDYLDFLTRISEGRGYVFDFTTTAQLEESIKNGNPHGIEVDPERVEAFVNGKNKTIVLNMDAKKSLNSLVGHEVVHTLEGFGEYDGLQEAVFKLAQTKGEFADRLASIQRRYTSLNEDGQNKELTSDLLGDYLFTDYDFIKGLSAEKPNIFKRVFDEIKYLYKMATAGSNEARELERVKHLFEKAWRESSEENAHDDSDVKFSIRTEAPPKETGIAYKVFYVKDGKLYPPMVANPDGADTPMGVWLDADVGASAPPSKTGRQQVKAGGKGTQGGSGSLAFRPGWHLGDLPRASQFDRVNPETGKKELFPENFVWAEVEYAKDADYQEEAMSYGYTDNGKFRHAYAGLPRLPENGYYRYRTNPKPDTVPWIITGAMKVNRLLSDAEVNAILEENGVAPVHRQGGDVGLDKFGFNEDGSVKYSLADSDGNQLTKEQQEYFKDSKVRDENGSLKVMYHGTPNAGFTKFRSGTYFTEHKWYADRYQSPGASSLGYKTTSENPDTYAVYLNIKKPFDTRNETERDIFYNEYYRQWGTGTDLMESGLPDWLDGMDLQEFIEEKGYDYDGLILDEGGVGGYGEEVVSRGLSYVTFNPEQVKNVDNTKPTSDPDIRFSLSDTVEETKDLMALHNLHSNELMKQLEMGGIPYPSIAITKPDAVSHDNFGEITLILNKNTIDPKANRYNKVYGGDAYTPTFPNVSYKADEVVAEKISETVNKHFDEIPKWYQSYIRTLRDETNLDEVLNRERGEQGLIERYQNEYGMKELYLAEKGEMVPLEIKRTETDLTEYQKDTARTMIEKLGVDVVEAFSDKGTFDTLFDARKQWFEQYGEQFSDTYAELLANDLGMPKSEAREIVDGEKLVWKFNQMRQVTEYLKNGGKTIKEEPDYGATEAKIDEKIAGSDYESWLRNLFAGIEGMSGIRNNTEVFTPKGKRRSFSQLHDPVTLDNIVKAMRNDPNQTGQGAFGLGNIQGASAQEYKSIPEIKKHSDRLGVMDEAEHKRITQHISDTFDEIGYRYAAGKDFFDAKATIAEAVSKNETKEGIARYLKQYDYVYRYDDSIVDDIIELRDYIRNLPTPYFEAKPQRAVSFDEIAAYVIPNNADVKLKQELLNRGYSIAEYDPNVEGDRKRVVNQFEQFKFSLSDAGQSTPEYGTYNVYGKDIALQQDIAPVAEPVQAQPETVQDYGHTASDNWRDVARNLREPELEGGSWTEEYLSYYESIKKEVQQSALREVLNNVDSGMTPEELRRKSEEAYREHESVQAKSKGSYTEAEGLMLTALYYQYSLYDSIAKNPSYANVVREQIDYGPLTEDQANERDTEQMKQSYFADEDGLPVREEGYNGTYAEHVKPSDPFYEKDIFEVGRDRKVKAYMYENPEVKPFFQQEARYMLGELDNSVKGEKFYNDQLYYDTNGEMGFFGTTRHTSEDIAYLLDTFNYTYKDIAKGLNAIIEDNGKENNAISKRIEFLLDERLRNGYTDFWFGDKIPPNQEYVNLLNSKQITEYNDESWNNWLRGLSEDDINTYFRGNTEATQAVPQSEYIPSEDIAPVKEEYEAIRPEPKKQPKMVRADKIPTVNEEVAKIMVEEPEVEKKKSRFFSKAMELVADKGFVFENLAKKTKNRNLEAKWNYIRYADGMAQDFIGNGADGVRALKDVQEEVQKAGLTEKLYEYVYHKHNIDRMSLENRYDDVPNKAVFGDSVTSEISQEAVKKLEAQYPALKRYANEIYAFNNHLRQMLVDGGVISQETADLWEEMYPHYVPIRRAGDFGLNINVPLDTGRTGVNAPVKRAVGGNQDILPLFDTMAQRAFQTYKAVAKNRFGVELKNTLGTTVETETADIDGIIEGIETQDELLKKGKRGKSSTFTVFDKGEKVTFEITDEMYDALKPTNETLAYTNKVANTISNVHRGLLTEYNPAFMARNAIKDAQDVLINSQHPAQTYKNFPKAIKEMATKGKWYTEYTKNGGEQNTYFDKETNTFAKEKSGLSKAIGLPLEAISKANNFIERLPRLAEYIASREAGRGVEESMLDAARVTTNFAAGGDLTKFLNRNGATFLNASVQGAMQQVRNVRDAKMNGLKGWTQLAAKYAVAGLPVVLLNGLMWDDDEEYEELSDYVKQNYYIVAKFGDGKFVRIPKGRTLAVIQNAMEQVANGLTGNDEVDLKSFLELAVSNLAPNNPIENNILAPIIQVANNTTWYGDDLVPTRLQDLPPREQSDESTDSISKWLGEKMGVSPYKINYLLDQYGGALGDMFLPMLTPEAESGDDSLLGNMLAPIKSAFTADSVMNNQNVSDFYDTSDTLTTNAKKAYATDEDILSNKYFNSVKAEVGKLYGEKREIQNSDLTDAEKYYLVREVQKKIDALTKEGLGEYENVNIDGVHATVGDLQFRKTDDGWEKITDKQLEKQDDVTSGLGITPSEYWSKKDEYDLAYESPEKYEIALKVGGYDAYMTYRDGMKDMKIDEKVDYVASLDLTTEQKNALINGETTRKEPIDLTGYEAYGDLEELDYATKNPGKYAVSRVIGDYETFAAYSDEIGDFRADKDSDGKSIPGSAKAKKKDYIFSLDLDYGQQALLYRMHYDSQADKDEYNPVIVKYLDSRNDVSLEEMVEILEALDMKWHPDGTITW